ncbi:unnamed protein product [Candidula unifasciata]|uniref:G-protein coupled receptors family 1 profile domain-containing protein n=1 Tax=Candidula unifasciata TaxID=100452 RepID=A0A8S3ZXS7_9EUPU|nr:unnamed protein product [Candidula unifasciata]
MLFQFKRNPSFEWVQTHNPSSQPAIIACNIRLPRFQLFFYFQVSNLFIVSLAVADVIVGIIVMPMNAFYIFTERWMLGVAVCQIWISVDYTASTASILNLFILSLDRYWSVRQPLKYLHKRTKRRALSMIAFVWAISSLWIIPIVSWHFLAHKGIRTVPNDVCDTEYAKNSIFKIVTAFFNFYLPLTVMYILYFRIFIAIRKRSEFELGQRSHGGKVLSYKINNPNSLEDSECNDDISFSADTRGGVRVYENGIRSQVPSTARNVHVLTVKRHQTTAGKDTSSGPCRVEYIYDENVIDPQTEKIERYYYEEHYPVPYLSRSIWMGGGEKYSSTIPRPEHIRSPRQLGEVKLSPTFHSMSSLANSSSRSNGSFVGNRQQFQQYLTVNGKHNAIVKRNIFRRHKKSNMSTLKQHNSIRLTSCKKYEPGETSFSPSFYIEPTNVSFSSTSSTSTFEDRRVDEHCMRRVFGAHDASGTRETTTDNGKLDSHPKVSDEKCSVSGPVKNLRRVESFLDKSTGFGISSRGSVDGSCSRNGDDSEGILVLRDDKNRRLTGGMTCLRERLKTIRQSSSLNKEIKAARQLGVIMGAFTLCFLPYFILFLVVAFCDNCVKPGHLTAATWVGYLNSTLNPFLYPLCNANFRIKFRTMLSCCKNGRSRLRSTQQENSRTHYWL